MVIEVLAISSAVVLLVGVLARRRFTKSRLRKNKELLSQVWANSLDPEQVKQIQQSAPRLKGNGTYSFGAVGTIPYSKNFDEIRTAKRLYFIEPTQMEVLLIPEPDNLERKQAVAVTIDSKLLGYVPAKEAQEIYKHILGQSVAVRAKAKIYLGSRPDYNGLMLDLAMPLRLEARRK